LGADRFLLVSEEGGPGPEGAEWVVVDMSATLLHHGHIRLLRFASGLGPVRVALTTDDEVQRWKGYLPELSFGDRKEILEAIRYVTDVVPAPWLITDEFLDDIGCRVLVHGGDNANPIERHEVVLVPRTEGVSSSEIRGRAPGRPSTTTEPVS
jgi:glycerol-3-phosphate cytidylyltransferase